MRIKNFLLLSCISFFAVAFSTGGALHASPSFRVQVIGKGTPMILIPGMSSSGDVWKSTVIHYQNKYECHVLSLAGFAGEPAVNEDAFLDHVKNDIIAYIRENHLQKPVIVGHSLGGFLALWIASTEPDLIGKIVVLDALPFLPAAFYPTITAQTSFPFASKLKYLLNAQTDTEYIATQKPTFRKLITDTATADAASLWGVHSSKATVAECMFEMQTTDLRGEIAKITSPVLVFATWIGYTPYQTHDGIAETFKAQYEQLPNYKLIVEDNAKNFVMLDDPLVFFAETDNFLSMP